MRIEAIKIRNYRVLKDVEITHLGGFAVFVGKNGTGKSTLFDVFAFLQECLHTNVRTALASRGGFEEVLSRDVSHDQNLEFEIKFREEAEKPLATYAITIGLSKESKMPIVKRETLHYRRGQKGAPWKFLDFAEGKGTVITNESALGIVDGKPENKAERQKKTLDSPDILALKGLGQFQEFPVTRAFRKYMEDWYFSDFHIQSARMLQDVNYSEQLSASGDNLANVTKYLYENKPEVLKSIIQKMKERVPGVSNVEARAMDDGRIALRFSDGTIKDPFTARYVSDGTIKLFAYLVLLNDPNHHSLVFVEEPENLLYPELLYILTEEFRNYAEEGGQVFVSTHSPDFLNAVKSSETYVIRKQNGFSSVQIAGDNQTIRNMEADGDKLGFLWQAGFFSVQAG